MPKVARMCFLSLSRPLLIGLAWLSVYIFVVIPTYLVLFKLEVVVLVVLVLTLAQSRVVFREHVAINQVDHNRLREGLLEELLVHDHCLAIGKEHQALRVDLTSVDLRLYLLILWVGLHVLWRLSTSGLLL